MNKHLLSRLRLFTILFVITYLIPYVLTFAASPAPGTTSSFDIAAFKLISPHPIYTHALITALAFKRSLIDIVKDISDRDTSQQNSIRTAIEELHLDQGIDGDRSHDVDFIEKTAQMNSTFSRPVVFSIRRALFEFVTANEGVDHAPATDYHSDYHFDAERFLQANARLATRIELAIDSLGGRNGLGSGDASRDIVLSRMLLAQSLHSAQDFYSHSSWSEIALLRAGVDPSDLNLAFYRFNGSGTTPMYVRI